MNNTIYFYAVNAGAIATMSPIFYSCPKDIKCVWVAEGYARKVLNRENEKTMDFDKCFNHLSNKRKSKSVLVLGPQHSYEKTVGILNRCEIHGIQTIFIIDHWGTNHLHFTLDAGSLVLPTSIFAVDIHVMSELLSLGISKNKITIIGHPGVEDKVNSANKMDMLRKKRIKNSININPDSKVILLALELFSQNFDEELEFGVVFKVIEVLESFEYNDIQLIVKLHPSQPRKKFLYFLDKHKLRERVILCPEKIKDFEIIAIVDLVIGMNSVILIIPLILGIPTISLGFDAINDSKRNITIPYLQECIVKSDTELSTIIAEKLSQKYNGKLSFPVGSIKKAWNEMRMLLSNESN
tara:strand:- start:1672 stop:2730 length:1059 start_codon:yes stop_codon:yes gene_type:complete